MSPTNILNLYSIWIIRFVRILGDSSNVRILGDNSSVKILGDNSSEINLGDNYSVRILNPQLIVSIYEDALTNI